MKHLKPYFIKEDLKNFTHDEADIFYDYLIRLSKYYHEKYDEEISKVCDEIKNIIMEEASVDPNNYHANTNLVPGYKSGLIFQINDTTIPVKYNHYQYQYSTTKMLNIYNALKEDTAESYPNILYYAIFETNDIPTSLYEYEKYLNSELKNINTIKNAAVYISLETHHTLELSQKGGRLARRQGKDMIRYGIKIGFIFTDFKFFDMFDKNNVMDFILDSYETERTNFLKILNALYGYADPKEIHDFVHKLNIEKDLHGQAKLNYTKEHRKQNDTERYEMEQNNQFYVFIARPKFVEKENGDFEKDIEIENMVPIDPYNFKDSHILSMMKLRAQIQAERSKVYYIWLPKDFTDLHDINSDRMKYLRKLIDKNKEQIK